MFDKARTWWHYWQHASALRRMSMIVNLDSRLTVHANKRIVSLYETSRGYIVTVATEEDGWDDPYSCTYHTWIGDAVDDWTQTALDLIESPRLWDDGAEYIRVK